MRTPAQRLTPDIRVAEGAQAHGCPSSLHRVRLAAMRVQRLLRLFCISVLVAWTSGCGEKLGGGSRGIAAGATVKTSVYGIRKGEELAFIIFTDLSSEGTETSAGSTWTGKIQPTTGIKPDLHKQIGIVAAAPGYIRRTGIKMTPDHPVAS